MFPLHDRTRRLLCRAVFIFAGVLPLAAAIAWASSVNSGAHLAAVRAQLAAKLGFEVRLAKVGYPRPGTTLLEGLKLADPETGESLFSARLLEIDRDEHREIWIASQPEINLAHAARVWPLVEQRLQSRPGTNRNSLRIAASELTLNWPGGAETLDCNAQFDSTADTNTLQAAFQRLTSPSAEPVQMRISRSPHSAQPATTIELNSVNAALPCSMLAALLGRENCLGSHSDFRGGCRMTQSPDGWQGEFGGKLENIDLNSAISEQFPHAWSGIADLEISKATFHDGRLEHCEGSLKAGPGTVNKSLVAAAVESLGMQANQPQIDLTTGAGNNSINYQEFNAAFQLSNSLAIRGQCGGNTGVILRSTAGVLLTENPNGAVPAVALVRALVPDSRVQVPATRQSDWLLHALPIPDIMPRDPQSPPQARVRGGREFH